MAQALIADTVPADAPVDLLILAFAVPDIAPGRATATYLSHVCPGTPVAFAICDQGTATAHTALRIAREYVGGGACRSALLVVVEQADLHHEAPAPVPVRHTAVLLRVDADTGAGTAVGVARQHPDVAADAVPALLAAEVAELSAGHDDVTVVLGELLAAAAGPVAVAGFTGARVAAAGSPYTGMWWELAGALSVTGRARRVLAADYDPLLRILSLTTTDVPARLPAALVTA
jgi:4-hydroxymandelate oxidase